MRCNRPTDFLHEVEKSSCRIIGYAKRGLSNDQVGNDDKAGLFVVFQCSDREPGVILGLLERKCFGREGVPNHRFVFVISHAITMPN